MMPYMPDVIKFDFFLREGITPILKKANIMMVHPSAKSIIPMGSESMLLILMLLVVRSLIGSMILVLISTFLVVVMMVVLIISMMTQLIVLKVLPLLMVMLVSLFVNGITLIMCGFCLN